VPVAAGLLPGSSRSVGHCGQVAEPAGVRAVGCSTAWRRSEREPPSPETRSTFLKHFFYFLCISVLFVHGEPDLICRPTVIPYEADTEEFKLPYFRPLALTTTTSIYAV